MRTSIAIDLWREIDPSLYQHFHYTTDDLIPIFHVPESGGAIFVAENSHILHANLWKPNVWKTQPTCAKSDPENHQSTIPSLRKRRRRRCQSRSRASSTRPWSPSRPRSSTWRPFRASPPSWWSCRGARWSCRRTSAGPGRAAWRGASPRRGRGRGRAAPPPSPPPTPARRTACPARPADDGRLVDGRDPKPPAPPPRFAHPLAAAPVDKVHPPLLPGTYPFRFQWCHPC